ncbi:MAG: gliding motility-associated C-terminal domain-containing protein, partial [Bacteroidales bacterium]|nr:gliding motility-associated C-terminal domain-containing protein [Bacteroidales bacterium]
LQWTTSGDGSFNNDAIEDPVYTPGATDISSGSVTLTLTAFGNAPCGNDADDMDLTIVPAPAVDAGLDATICSDGTHALNATASDYSSLQWSTSGDGSFNNDAIEDPIYTPGSNDISSGSVTLTLTAFGNAPCGNDVDGMDLTIVTAPSADAGLDAIICDGDTHSLNATASNYLSLQWTTGGDGSFNNDAIEDPVYTPGPTDITNGFAILMLTAFGNAPCGNDADNMVLNIAPNPVAVAASNSPVCQGDILNLFSMPNGMVSYNWTGPDSYTSGLQNPTVSNNATTDMAGDYIVTVVDGNGCSDNASTTVVVTIPPTVDAGPNDSVCYGDTLYITGASASNYSSLLWTSSSGHNGFSNNNILNPYYVPGSTDQANGQVTLYLTAFGSGPCFSVIDSMILKLPPQMQVSISSVSAFVIGPDTEIEISLTYEDHLVVQDLGYFLQAPDGMTTLTLKDAEDPAGMCNFYGGVGTSVNLDFSTEEPAGDTVSICVPGFFSDISGTYNITDNWSTIYGQNPADGGWAIVIKDYLSTEGSGNPDGRLVNASISFTDTSIFTGELTTIQFESGVVNIPIIEGDGFTPGGVTYAVPLGLRTSCADVCDALAQVTVSGGTPPYLTYNWDDPLVPDEQSVYLCEGIYNVTVTDAMGCTGSTSVEVFSPPAIVIDTVFATPLLSCFEDSTGIIQVGASGGTGSLTFYLVPDSIPSELPDSGAFTGLPAGTYTVRVEDARGCFIDTTVTINEPLPIVLESAVITDSVLCLGDNDGRIVATASGGTAPYTFILEPVLTVNNTGIFDNLSPGTYYVRVTDANDCDTIDSETLVLLPPSPLIVDTVIVSPIICNGGTGSLNVITIGGEEPYEISIIGGPGAIPGLSGDEIFADLGPGNYDVVVTDANSCTATWPTVTLVDPPALILDSLVITPVVGCYTDNNGEIAVYVSGGVGDIEYSIDGSPYQSDSIFTGLSGGDYTIFYRDSLTCTHSIDTTMISPPQLFGNVIDVQDVQGENLGSITLSPYGGTPFTVGVPYRYSINGGPLGTDSVFTDLTANTYDLHVEDSLGCPWDSTVIISLIQLPVNLVITNATCYGDQDGAIRFEFPEHTITSFYDIYVNSELIFGNLNAPFFVYTDLGADTCIIFIEDDLGRQFNGVAIITEPDSLVVNRTVIHPACAEFDLDGNPSEDGSISLTTTRGNGEYVYEWNNSGTSDSTQTGLGVGMYIATITDSEGCSTTDTTELVGQVAINASLGISPNYPTVDAIFCDDTIVCPLSEWDLTVRHDQSGVEYSWSPAGLLDDPGDADEHTVSITARQSATFSVTVTTANCLDEDEMYIEVADTIGLQIMDMNLQPLPDIIYSPINVPIELLATTGFLSYNWSGSGFGEIDSVFFSYARVIPGGDYTVTLSATSEYYCVEYDTLYIVIQRPIEDVYSVFTPNDDGYNDYWEIPHAEEWQNVEVFIFNRWGQQVFYSKNYGIDNENKWDGNSQKNGKPLPMGTYYYIIKPNDGLQEPWTGTVTIVR